MVRWAHGLCMESGLLVWLVPLALLCGLLWGCQSAPDREEPFRPQTQTHVSHRLASPEATAVAGTPRIADDADAWLATATWWYVPRVPLGQPLPAETRVVRNPATDSEMRVAPRLGREVRWIDPALLPDLLEGPAAGAALLGTESVALFPEVVGVVRLEQEPGHQVGIDEAAVHLQRVEPDSLQLSLFLTGREDQWEQDDTESATYVRGELDLSVELLELVVPASGGSTVAMFLAPWSDWPEGGCFLQIEWQTRATDGAALRQLGNAAARCREDLRPVEAEPAEVKNDPFAKSLRSLEWMSTRRRALIHLADLTHASLTRDLALSATTTPLQEVAQKITARVDELGASPDAEQLGLWLEQASLWVLASLLRTGLPYELEAILVRHLGQAGRHAASLEELAANANGLEQLQRLIEEENFIFLQDSSPSARVRAYDWLVGRDRAPLDFDPLAPVAQRRAAIRKALDKLAEESTP